MYDKMKTESTCYKCKAPVEFNIPVISKDFYMMKCVCTCGHEMATGTPKCPVQRQALKDGFQNLKEHLESP